MDKKDNNRQNVILSLMVMAILLIAELYVMIHMAGSMVPLIIVTILFLGSAYFFGKAILKEIHDSNTKVEEQYEAMAKSGKASYLLLKKTIEQLEEMDGKAKTPADDIITAQKAIAKVTISRNKENTDALMNSNDKVLEKIFDFEENLGNNQSSLLDRQRQLMDDSMKELMIKQQEMTSTMKAMEESIKSELLQAMSNMQIAQPQESINDINVEEPELAIEDIDLGEPELAMEDIDLGEPELSMEDIDLGESEQAIEDIDFVDNLGLTDTIDLGLSEDLALDESIDLGEPSISADIDLGIDLLLEEEEPLMEEASAVEPEFVEPEFAEPEFAAEEDTGMPDLSDPNKLMTPDEIAALIAKM